MKLVAYVAQRSTVREAVVFPSPDAAIEFCVVATSENSVRLPAFGYSTIKLRRVRS
jgi:hypothetical protein